MTLPSRQYSKHFTKFELQDPSTGKIKLADRFIVHLEALRVSYNDSMSVTSGCRSSEHNLWLRERGYAASPNSFHLMENPKYKTGGCCAIDIVRPSPSQLHVLMRLALAKFWTVRIGGTFIHLDLRTRYGGLVAHVGTY